MNPVLTSTAMREADRRTIHDFGFPSFTLMENAGRAAADAIMSRYGARDRSVVVLCGKGNNGGDGLVVARVLHSRGARVHVITLASEEDTTPDAALNLALLRRIGQAEAANGRLSISPWESMETLRKEPPADLLVDALLGTALSGPPRGAIAEIIAWINERSEPVAAIDVPSGVNSDTGRVEGEAVQADLTVTMASAKVGLLINEGRLHTGEIVVAEIGIPSSVVHAVAQEPGSAFCTDDRFVKDRIPRLAPDAHKFSAGHAFVVAGSTGLTGAAALASRAAEAAGAGYVVCACPTGVQPVLAQKLTTIMTLGLPQTQAGTIAPDAVDLVLERAARAQALLVGCGLGRDPATRRFVHALLEEIETPVVLDADGLDALAGHMEIVRDRSEGQWILTPHWGEFRKLTQREDIQLQDRLRLAGHYAQEWNCVLLVKGLPSVVASPQGRAWIGTTDTVALATAGTGDVLAGLITGLRARGLSAEDAAVCALHLGGAAADAYVTCRAPETMTALDLLEGLPDVITSFLQHRS